MVSEAKIDSDGGVLIPKEFQPLLDEILRAGVLVHPVTFQVPTTHKCYLIPLAGESCESKPQGK